MRSNGEQLGFIPAYVSRGGDSSGLAFQMDHGSQYRCTISDITGGGEGRSVGVNIEVTEVRPDSVLPTETTPTHFNATPVPIDLSWLWFVAAGRCLPAGNSINTGYRNKGLDKSSGLCHC